MLEPENDLAQEAFEGGGYNCSELAGRRPLEGDQIVGGFSIKSLDETFVQG